jgi:hypothetical protein
MKLLFIPLGNDRFKLFYKGKSKEQIIFNLQQFFKIHLLKING